MARRPTSAAALEAAEEARAAVPPRELAAIRSLGARARDLDLEIRDLEQRLSDKKKQRLEILQKTLPDMCQAVGLRGLTLEAEGNVPAYAVTVQPHYYANIAADWEEERRDAALRWIEKKGEGDMIKSVLTVELGRGTSALQKKVTAALRKLRVPFASKRTVPHQTLTAWVREEYRKGRPLGDQDREVIGATVGVVATLKEIK